MNNAKKRAEIVKRIVDANYEPGRQDRCKLWVFRNIVSKELPIGERTFWRYIGEDTDNKHEDDPRQRKIDFGE